MTSSRPNLQLGEMIVGLVPSPQPAHLLGIGMGETTTAKQPKRKQQPKVLYKSPTHMLKSKNGTGSGNSAEKELLIASPILLKPVISSRPESVDHAVHSEQGEQENDMPAIVEEKNDNDGHPLERLAKRESNPTAKQVRWEKSQKAIGTTFNFDPHSELPTFHKNVEKFTEIPHVLDGFKMVASFFYLLPFNVNV